MKAGQLNTRITIRAYTETVDGWGQPVQTWTDLAAVWADVRGISGLEAIKADAETSTTKASARIRYRADVSPDMRVLIAGTEWEIKAVLPDFNRRRYVDLTLERVQ